MTALTLIFLASAVVTPPDAEGMAPRDFSRPGAAAPEAAGDEGCELETRQARDFRADFARSVGAGEAPSCGRAAVARCVVGDTDTSSSERCATRP